jgi:hypothetical protein
LVVIALCFAGLFAPGTAAASSTVIDFSSHGEGAFDQSYFSGIRFTQGSFIGYIQGDQALVGPIAGDVSKKFTTISASVAPTVQGTALYTLSAYKNSRPIGSSSVPVTQDTGDPASVPFGYTTITLDLQKKADSFRLSNTFVRSSFPHIALIEFGTSSITIGR